MTGIHVFKASICLCPALLAMPAWNWLGWFGLPFVAVALVSSSLRGSFQERSFDKIQGFAMICRHP